MRNSATWFLDFTSGGISVNWGNLLVQRQLRLSWFVVVDVMAINSRLSLSVYGSTVSNQYPWRVEHLSIWAFCWLASCTSAWIWSKLCIVSVAELSSGPGHVWADVIRIAALLMPAFSPSRYLGLNFIPVEWQFAFRLLCSHHVQYCQGFFVMWTHYKVCFLMVWVFVKFFTLAFSSTILIDFDKVGGNLACQDLTSQRHNFC